MKITYKNFTIEQDRSCYVLTEYGIMKKWDNIGDEFIKDQVYPTTLERCIEKIAYKLRKSSPDVLELKEAIECIKQTNKEFINDIKDLFNKK